MDPVQIDTSSITWLGISTLILLIVGIGWQMHATGKSLFGVVNDLFKKQNLSIIMGVIILLNLAEAMIAASLLLSSQKYSLNLVARFIGHISISAASLACALFISDSVKAVGEAFKAIHVGAIIVRLLRLTIVVNLAWFLPCFNALIISNGLHETAAVRLLWANLFGSREYYMYLLAKGNPAIGPGALTMSYEPWDSLTYPMATTLGITAIHIIFLALDLLIVLDPLELRKKKEADAADAADTATDQSNQAPGQANAPADEDPKTANAYEESLLKVLKFYGLTEATLAAKFKACQNIISSQTDPNRVAIAKRVHDLDESMKAFKAANYSGAKEESEKSLDYRGN